MSVRATEAEGADSAPGRRGSRRPGLDAGDDPDRQDVESDVRIGLLEMEARCELAVVQAQRQFDQPGNSGGRFQMSNVGFHRADGTPSVARAAGCHHGAKGVQLNRIPENGSGAMCLDVLELRWTKAGVG